MGIFDKKDKAAEQAAAEAQDKIDTASAEGHGADEAKPEVTPAESAFAKPKGNDAGGGAPKDELKAGQSKAPMALVYPEDAMLIGDFKVIDVAEMTHEINRAWCEKHNDKTQKPWIQAPTWQRESAVLGVIAALNAKNPTPSYMHGMWSKHKSKEGWVYGEKKCEIKKTHPCLVAHHQLPLYQQVKDRLFLATVLAFKKDSAI